MKYKLGFVSNSSSTSFTLTCAKNDFDDIFKDLPAHIQYLLNPNCATIGKLFGIETITFNGYSEDYSDELYSYGCNIVDEFDNEVIRVDDGEYRYKSTNKIAKNIINNKCEALQLIRDKLFQAKKDYIYNSECC